MLKRLLPRDRIEVYHLHSSWMPPWAVLACNQLSEFRKALREPVIVSPWSVIRSLLASAVGSVAACVNQGATGTGLFLSWHGCHCLNFILYLLLCVTWVPDKTLCEYVHYYRDVTVCVKMLGRCGRSLQNYGKNWGVNSGVLVALLILRFRMMGRMGLSLREREKVSCEPSRERIAVRRICLCRSALERLMTYFSHTHTKNRLNFHS